MIIDIRRQVCDGQLFKWLIAAGLTWLEHNQEHINQMNVFPVPDGDTGTNMRFTMQKAYDEIAQMDDSHVGIIAQGVAKGALLGARGNSGVILSQLLKGFADGLRGQDVIDAQNFTHACHQAVAAAYRAVNPPVEGTILTVAREAVDAAAEYTRTHDDLPGAFEHLLDTAHRTLEKTPELMPLLKQAGVVDSGGMGLLYILEGMHRFLRGEPVRLGGTPAGINTPAHDQQNGHHSSGSPKWQAALIPQDAEGYGYDVQFLMRGSNLNVDEIRTAMEAMGWSTLVVGEPTLVKVHIHVHNPGEPLSYAIHYGAALDDIVVENMQLQYHEYVRHRLAEVRSAPREVEGVAVITVASGAGLEKLFYDGLGAARVITGGQTMNPSAEDFLTAIDSLPNKHILLLPNNSNIIMAAQQAAALARGKEIHVMPTRSIPQGITAMLATFDLRGTHTPEALLEMMHEAIHQIKTGEITVATRDVEMGGLRVNGGDYIGLLNDHLVAAGADLTTVVRDLLLKARADEHELITLYYGDNITEAKAKSLADILTAVFPGLQVEIIAGGQPLYPYILSIE